jgi:hypothetical protein
LRQHELDHAGGAAGGNGLIPGGSRRASAVAGDSVSLSVRRWDELEKAVKEQVGGNIRLAVLT